MARIKKSIEDITKANLARTLSKMKVKVAESQEVWLDLFELILPLVKEDESVLEEKHVMTASLIVDRALEEYERRWGKSL